jgi:hypothetical protein
MNVVNKKQISYILMIIDNTKHSKLLSRFGPQKESDIWDNRGADLITGLSNDFRTISRREKAELMKHLRNSDVGSIVSFFGRKAMIAQINWLSCLPGFVEGNYKCCSQHLNQIFYHSLILFSKGQI